MDASHLGALSTSLGIARDLAKALVGLRDWNLVAEKVTTLHDQILKAQDALLSHNASTFELQNKYFEACEELRKLKEAINEKGRYSLVELGFGFHAYRENVTPEQSGTGQPGPPQPERYFCQSCMDRGAKLVLQSRFEEGVCIGWRCTGCNTTLLNGQGVAMLAKPVATASGGSRFRTFT
ncbi:hypothetical protein [Variovorax sp.]|jgi:hypothetical protein|uniref:hypothetical protein n=1 Tax=Variovorax sp. TaxID=1871043 RepID=UPI0037D9C9E8